MVDKLSLCSIRCSTKKYTANKQNHMKLFFNLILEAECLDVLILHLLQCNFNFRSIVSKKQGICSLAYAFIERPVEIGKPIVMCVKKIDNYCKELLVYGITSCDPSSMKSHEFPENVYDLLDRKEYWIVQEKSCSFDTGDTITFTLNEDGNFLFIYF